VGRRAENDFLCKKAWISKKTQEREIGRLSMRGAALPITVTPGSIYRPNKTGAYGWADGFCGYEVMGTGATGVIGSRKREPGKNFLKPVKTAQKQTHQSLGDLAGDTEVYMGTLRGRTPKLVRGVGLLHATSLDYGPGGKKIALQGCAPAIRGQKVQNVTIRDAHQGSSGKRDKKGKGRQGTEGRRLKWKWGERRQQRSLHPFKPQCCSSRPGQRLRSVKVFRGKRGL